MTPSSSNHEHSPFQRDRNDRPKVVDVFRRHGDDYLHDHALSSDQRRLLFDMLLCRTSFLGGYLYKCSDPDCSFEQPRYNSCNNRCCPNCQALAQAIWIAKRTDRILPVGHHHVVTTLPPQLRPLAHAHPRECYDLLFSATAGTLLTLAKELGFRIGITAVLHTWTRELKFHPHVHVVVTAGGLSFDDKTWIDRSRYLFPQAQMKAIFRSNILAGLDKLRRSGLRVPGDVHSCHPDPWRHLIESLPPRRKWVLFIEPPMGTSSHVISYLGRYVHRIAISDQRLVAISDSAVTFRTRGDSTLTLSPTEFIRRFLMHALPSRLRKIRHFGLYAPANVNGRLELARQINSPRPALATAPALTAPSEPTDIDHQEQEEPWVQLLASLTGNDPLLCPLCKKSRLERGRRIPRSPP